MQQNEKMNAQTMNRTSSAGCSNLITNADGMMYHQVVLTLKLKVVNKTMDFNVRSAFFIFIFLFGFGSIHICKSCNLPIDTISRQGQVDSFNINYPRCTKIAGNLVITGAITNLDSLYTIRQISGTLSILNTQLKNCLGLYNLDTIFGFRCKDNAVLKNLYGLESLTYAGALYIENNVALEELHSISSTDFNDFFLHECPEILVILGFNTPILLSNIVIENNDGIITIDAFHHVEEITGDYKIIFCSNLETLMTGTKLKIVNSSLQFLALTKLEVFPPFANLIRVNNYLSLVSLTSLKHINSFNNLERLEDLRIYNAKSLENLPSFPKLTLISKSLDLGTNNKIRYIDGFNALDSVLGSLRIFRFDSLIDIIGFNNLKYVSSQFHVGTMRSLKRISGFGLLNKVEHSVYFGGLELITELNSFSKLDDIAGITNMDYNKLNYLGLSGNEMLSYCHYLPICRKTEAGLLS